MSDDGCIFCKIVKGEIPCHKILEDEKHLAFLSIFPNTDGFTIVIPKKHYSSYVFDNSDDVITDLILFTKKVAKILDNYFEDVGRCGVVFEGFGVDHLHSKIYPMHGTNNSEWKPIEAKEDVFFEKYPGYLITLETGKPADSEKLAELAKNIRDSINQKS